MMKRITLADLEPGSTVMVDERFDCMDPGPKIVEWDEKGARFLSCSEGRHYLDGQEAFLGGPLVGIWVLE